MTDYPTIEYDQDDIDGNAVLWSPDPETWGEAVAPPGRYAMVSLPVGVVLRRTDCPTCKGNGRMLVPSKNPKDGKHTQLPDREMCPTCRGVGGWPTLWAPCNHRCKAIDIDGTVGPDHGCGHPRCHPDCVNGWHQIGATT